MSKKILPIGSLIAALTLLSSFALIPAANAYGQEQFQIGFSFNCNSAVAGNVCNGVGFWGWCTFGGGGTTGDCQITFYNFNGVLGLPAFGPAHLSIDYTRWTTGTGSFALPTQPSLPGFFAMGAGTSILTGSGANILQALFPSSFTCPSTPVPSPNFLCDTGIPAVPGHYTWNQIPFLPFLPTQPGLHLNEQVTQIS